MKANNNGSKPATKKQAESDAAVSYNEFKEFEGQKYTGMKVGRSHRWHYDQGEWRDRKITPDLWQISYAVTKRRAGHAPEGSGVPVGTEYHWYIVAHQNVRKLNANDYTTSMTGLKFKIAHKRADSEKWSATQSTQRKRMIRFLQDVIKDLEQQQNGAEKAAVTAGKAKKVAAKAPKKAAKKSTRRAPARKQPAAPKSMTKPARRRWKSAA